MRQHIRLAKGWHLKQVEEGLDMDTLLEQARHPDGSWLATDIPAQVHDVLLAHGRIPDPRVGKNAAEVTWVAWRDWAYSCRFPTPQRPQGHAILRFDGLDTLADVYLNGRLVGRFDNMFRQWVVPVSGELAPEGEENVLVVYFRSVNQVIENIQQPATHVDAIKKNKYIRKSAQDFGPYLGPRPDSIKVGIFRDVILDLAGPSWIDDIWVRTTLSSDQRQALIVADVEIGGEAAPIAWTLIDPAGGAIAQGSGPATHIEIPVREPELWWPWTHGAPQLYTLHIELGPEGQACDQSDVMVGIRDIRLETQDPATLRARFKFWINGEPIFLKGAGLAPIEGKSNCWDQARAHRLLDMAQHAHMNLLRVWGGGTLADDAFYDECDRRGILVWQDFTFGYGMYPDDDPAFNENVRLEVEGLVRRLRNHPSILLWVGGNENHMGYDFVLGGQAPLGRKLFEEIIPRGLPKHGPHALLSPQLALWRPCSQLAAGGGLA